MCQFLGLNVNNITNWYFFQTNLLFSVINYHTSSKFYGNHMNLFSGSASFKNGENCY